MQTTVQIMAKLFGKRYTPNLRFYNFEIIKLYTSKLVFYNFKILNYFIFEISIAKIAVIDDNLTVTIKFVWNVQFSISK